MLGTRYNRCDVRIVYLEVTTLHLSVRSHVIVNQHKILLYVTVPAFLLMCVFLSPKTPIPAPFVLHSPLATSDKLLPYCTFSSLPASCLHQPRQPSPQLIIKDVYLSSSCYVLCPLLGLPNQSVIF